jgi:hypothetical protein
VTRGRLTDDELIARGGSVWDSRLLIRGELDDLTVAVVDANGDGAVYEVVTMVWSGRGWDERASGSAGILADGWDHGVAYAYGHTPGVDAVDVGLRGELRRVPVNEHGWWLVLETAEEEERFDLSGVPDPFPMRPPPGDAGPPRIAG